MRHEDEELSESQRLSMLEATVSTNRVGLMIMAVSAVIAISVAVTVAVVNIMRPDISYVEAREFSRLQGDVEILKEAAIAYEKSVNKTRRILDASNASALKALMLEQEQSYQTHLNALKQGMRELAKMIPGSRTWLDIYDEQMDIALEQSRARMKRLAEIQTSELPDMKSVTLPDLPGVKTIEEP
ncbi:MAG: hypothetical protein CMI02_08805 [Oceanospirillaceae bacterium]|nr:hypothetical protein [Oceanospirillaceae bacterium]MBT12120.1 hypothetical protein [Oceanospirillaceae bacterium]